MERVLGLWGQ